MKKLIFYAVGTALLAAGAASCGHGADDRRVEFRVAEHGSSFRLLNSAAEFGSDEDMIFADSVNLVIPMRVFGADINPLLDSIMSLAFDSVGADFDAVMRDHLLSTASGIGYAVEPVDTTAADGFNVVTGTVVNLSPELLVYCVTTSEYPPAAAHGMTTSYYINYDMASGRVLTLREIFDNKRLNDLAAAIQTQADALEQIIGPTGITELPSHDNFMLSPSGEIVFVYQPYEAASFAQGAIKVSFYPYELVDYMTPFGKKYFRLADFDNGPGQVNG